VSTLVTGDAVVLEVRPAQLPSRMLSISIDVVVQLAALLVLSILVASVSDALSEGAVAAIALVCTVGVLVGYPTVFETLSRGRTLGKLCLGLRVVRDDGGPAGFRQALVRALFGVVEIWISIGVIAVLASLSSANGKRLGDQFAGTTVVRERTPRQGDAVAQMPPWLIPWAVTADLSRVPDDLALAARTLIARGPELDPATRAAMARDLATAIGRVVAPPSPPGTSAEAYLSAVLAERRRRELLRLGSPGQQLPPVAQAWQSSPPAQAHPAQPHPAADTPQAGGFAPPA
jgi:uncharacterized RDD family membrane protein YckC